MKIRSNETKNDLKTYVDAEFSPESLNVEKRTVDSVFTTPRRVLRIDWEEGIYFYEELSLDPNHMRTERIEKGIPVLDNHDRYSGIRNQLGKAKGLFFDTNGIPYTTLRFSRKEVAQEAFQDVADGIVDKTSIGYMVHEYKKLDEKQDGIEVRLAVDWEATEISLTPIPADIDAQVRSIEPLDEKSILKNTKLISNVDQKHDQGEQPMPTNEINKEELKAPAVNVKEIEEKAMIQERSRVSEINKQVERFQLDKNVGEKLIEDGTSIDDARAIIMDAVADKEPAQVINTAVNEVGMTGAERKREALTNIMCHRANPEGVKLEAGRDFVGMSMAEISRHFVDGSIANKHDLAVRAMSSSDFQSATDHASSMTLERSFQEAKQTFWPFTTEGTLSDYKEVSRVSFSAVPNLKDVKEGGEYEKASMDQNGEAIKVSKKGILVPFTEECIMNDSLDFLQSISTFGAAASRAESDAVYAVINGSHKMKDGNELYHASRGNIGTPGVVSETTLDAVYKFFGQITTKGKNSSPVNIDPRYIVAGADSRMAILKMLKLIDPTNSGDVNVFAGDLNPIFDARMYGKGWRVFASKSDIKTIELAYLEGMKGPQITSHYDYKTDTIEHKIKHVFGTKAINSVATYKSLLV